MNDTCAMCKKPMITTDDGVRRHRSAEERDACYFTERIFSGARLS